jgi:hypothetical protein
MIAPSPRTWATREPSAPRGLPARRQWPCNTASRPEALSDGGNLSDAALGGMARPYMPIE